MGSGVSVSVLHMIGNAHIDPVWLWQWPEGYQEVRATFRSAADRLDEYPEFVFTSTSAAFFAWVEESDPELFERIRSRIVDGRWQVIGGWWVEPDCNIPSGESLVRQGLHGQRYLRERFGLTATVGANIDSFGHNAMLPQLLRRSGLDSYVFLRPQAHELELPKGAFCWESPDGSRVLAYRIPYEYCSPGADLAAHVNAALEQLGDAAEAMVFYGVGNHGGGPTRANLDSIRTLASAAGSTRIECSAPRAFFDAAAQATRLPSYAGELQHHAVGCYSAHSGIKRWNRRAENQLLRAEKWAAVAERLAGSSYPLAELDEAWKLVLFNQFHDTLAGTAIAPAYEDARDELGHASSLAERALNRALQSVARRVAIPQEDGTATLLVFNPHPWPVLEPVELEFGGFREGEPQLVDDEGRVVPVQKTRSYATVAGARCRLAFPGELPPLGYRLYRLRPGDGAGGSSSLGASGTALENEHLAVSVDPLHGGFTSIYVKASGVELAGTGPHAVVVDDPSDTWGHRVRSYDHVIGEFECSSVSLVETGPARALLRSHYRYGSSSLCEEISLLAGAPYVDIRVALDWREQQKLLKLRFPAALSRPRATFEIPYGSLERAAAGAEQPMQSWVDVSGPEGGLAVLNDGKHGCDVVGADIGVTVVRSPPYAWHEPRELTPGERYEYMDQGEQQFTLRLVPHGGDWRRAGIPRLAAQLNQPPVALLESSHDGELPATASQVAVRGPESVVLTVVKCAEDGSGDVIVRASETAGAAASASIELPVFGRSLEASFGPFELKTFRLPSDPAAPPLEVDLLES